MNAPVKARNAKKPETLNKEDAILALNRYLSMKHKLVIGATLCVIVIALLVAVGGSRGKDSAPSSSPPLPGVEVAEVEQQDVPIHSEWIGTLDGMVNAEIRAQVAGYLRTQRYTEGSFVKKGQLLFEIDPRPFQAALDQAGGELAKAEGQVTQANGQLSQASAQLMQAEANQGKTRLDVDRYTPLAKQKAITDQEFDNAIQANLAAKAQVEAARAGVETAKAAIVAAKAAVEAARAAVAKAELDLGFTRITSPIDGIAGIAQAQVGNLINPTSGALTTVSTVDPIKVYFTLSEQEYLNHARRAAPGTRPARNVNWSWCWLTELLIRRKGDSSSRTGRSIKKQARSSWPASSRTRGTPFALVSTAGSEP